MLVFLNGTKTGPFLYY